MPTHDVKLMLYRAMSSSDFEDVGKFHAKFGLPVADPPGPTEVTRELIEFRLKFLLEELREIGEGFGYHLVQNDGEVVFEPNGAAPAAGIDHEKVFDGLIDLNYVSHGTAHLLGYPWPVGWNAVQRANMAKERCVRAEDSARGSTFDVIKPKGWQPPDIKSILRSWGFKL